MATTTDFTHMTAAGDLLLIQQMSNAHLLNQIELMCRMLKEAESQLNCYDNDDIEDVITHRGKRTQHCGAKRIRGRIHELTGKLLTYAFVALLRGGGIAKEATCLMRKVYGLGHINPPADYDGGGLHVYQHVYEEQLAELTRRREEEARAKEQAEAEEKAKAEEVANDPAVRQAIKDLLAAIAESI